MLCKHLKLTEDWYLYVKQCCYVLNTYTTPSMGYSAFELIYLQKAADPTNIEYSL